MYTVVKNRGMRSNYQLLNKESWKSWWENHAGRIVESCSRYGCNEKATSGGHVYITNANKEVFVVPLCESCSHRNDEFYVHTYDLLRVQK